MSRRAPVDAVSTANKENDWTPMKTSKSKSAAKPALSAISSNVQKQQQQQQQQQQPSKNNQPPLKNNNNSASKLRLMDSPRLSPLVKSNLNNASFDAMRSGFSFDFGSALVDSSTYISSPFGITHSQTVKNELNGEDEDPFGFFKADRDFDRFLKATTANKSGNFSTSVSLQHQHQHQQQQQNVSQVPIQSNIASPNLPSVPAAAVAGYYTQQQNILSSPSQKSMSVSTDSSPMAPGQKKRVAWYEKSQSPAPKPKAVPKKKSVPKPKARSKAAATIHTDEFGGGAGGGGGVVLGGGIVGDDGKRRRSHTIRDRVDKLVVVADSVKPACAVENEVLETEGLLDQPDEETEKDTRPKKRQKKVVPAVAHEGASVVGRVTRSRARKQ
ncbi:hypothetical protein HDU80_001360 [Chytriomyces hyalinus]|nr:hypothetical protein HDU80_001360 [Chytriomyces hyalinus]